MELISRGFGRALGFKSFTISSRYQAMRDFDRAANVSKEVGLRRCAKFPGLADTPVQC